MWICKYVLTPMTTVGFALAQASPQPTESPKPLLDLTWGRVKRPAPPLATAALPCASQPVAVRVSDDFHFSVDEFRRTGEMSMLLNERQQAKWASSIQWAQPGRKPAPSHSSAVLGLIGSSAIHGPYNPRLVPARSCEEIRDIVPLATTPAQSPY
jgi:hypothetical protein